MVYGNLEVSRGGFALDRRVPSRRAGTRVKHARRVKERCLWVRRRVRRGRLAHGKRHKLSHVLLLLLLVVVLGVVSIVVRPVPLVGGRPHPVGRVKGVTVVRREQVPLGRQEIVIYGGGGELALSPGTSLKDVLVRGRAAGTGSAVQAGARHAVASGEQARRAVVLVVLMVLMLALAYPLSTLLLGLRNLPLVEL